MNKNYSQTDLFDANMISKFTYHITNIMNVKKWNFDWKTIWWFILSLLIEKIKVKVS